MKFENITLKETLFQHCLNNAALSNDSDIDVAINPTLLKYFNHKKYKSHLLRFGVTISESRDTIHITEQKKRLNG